MLEFSKTYNCLTTGHKVEKKIIPPKYFLIFQQRITTLFNRSKKSLKKNILKAYEGEHKKQI